MIRIKPLHEKDADPQIKRMYEQIKQSLHTSLVPLYFQYMGLYPEYFQYAWEKIYANIKTEAFQKAEKQIQEVTDAITEIIYSPTQEVTDFIGSLQGVEKEHIENTVSDLRYINTALMILTIAVRESIKGIPVGVKKLEDFTRPGGSIEEDPHIFDSLLKQQEEFSNDPSLAQASKLLVPIFGSQALTISNYPDFFRLIAEEVEHLVKKESYLKARVELERLVQFLISGFSESLNFSYKETARFLYQKPHVDEFLYLLKDTFPSQFPRLVITTSIMRKILTPRSEVTVG